MSLIVDEYVRINDNIKTLIKSGNYEKIIFELMNLSKIVFPNEYEHILMQSRGECDFVDLTTKEKYDVKLPFTPEQGRLIGSNNSDYFAFYKSIQDELEEFGNYVEGNEQFKFENLTLYQIMEKQIMKDKLDENLIFFFPYPVVFDHSEFLIVQFVTDVLSKIFYCLKNRNVIGNRKIYVIYPSHDTKITIRCLNDDKREYLPNDILNKYISYEMNLY